MMGFDGAPQTTGDRFSQELLSTSVEQAAEAYPTAVDDILA